ncbi:MAG: LamB/YcsF family protein [Vicinamibacterales bacterium]
MRVDLNADVGELSGQASAGGDDGLLPHVTSVNVACGLHAGDPGTMRRTVASAGRWQVAVGAHPGFADRPGFGRRPMALSAPEVEALVAYQVGALLAVARLEGVPLRHVKPHGALYTMAAHDRALAAAIARAVASVDDGLALVGLAGSCLLPAAAEAGLHAVGEAFADRSYRADGSLVPRDQAEAVLTDPAQVVARAVRMVREHQVQTVDGGVLRLVPDTICVHGDTPGAVELARALRRGLEAAGVSVGPACPDQPAPRR